MQRLAQWLVKWEIGVATAAVLGSFISARFLPWALGVLLLFWPLRWLAYRRFTQRTPADWPIVGLALLVPVTLWATALPEVTQPQVLRLLVGMGWYYALANAPLSFSLAANRLRGLRWLAAALAALCLGLSAFALISVDWSSNNKLPFIPARLYTLFPQWVTDTANANVMGGSVLILLAAVSGLLLFAGRPLRWFEGLWYALAALAGVGVLVLTQSRGAVLALGLSGVLLVVLRWRWGWLAALVSAVGLVVAFNIVGATPLINLLVSSATLGGVDGRVEVWSRAIYMVQDFPFTGVGMGSYGRVADLLYPFFLYAPGKVQHAHNLLLQIAVDLGIPGLVCWLAAWMLVLATAAQVYRRGRQLGQRWLAGWGAGLLAAQVALLAHGMVDAVTWGMVRPAPFVWALWGLTAAACAVVAELPAHNREHV